MKRNFVSLLFVSLLLVGCTSQGSSLPSSMEISVSTSDLTSFADQTIQIAVSETETSFVKEKVEHYLSELGHSEMKVEMQVLSEADLSSLSDWTDGPDLYSFASSQLWDLKQKGALVAVPTEEQEKLSSLFSAKTIAASTLGNHLYGYAYGINSTAELFYDKSVITHLDSLEGVLDDCIAAGRKMIYPLSSGWYAAGLLSSFGAGYQLQLNEKEDQVLSIQSDFDTEKGLSSGKLLQNLIQNETALTDSLDDGIAPTAADGIGACISGSWNYSSFQEVLGDNLGVCSLPRVTIAEESQPLCSYMEYQYYGINPLANEEAGRVELLSQLADYLVSASVQQDRYQQFTIIPTAIEAQKTISTTAPVSSLIQQEKHALPQTLFPEHLWEASETLYTAIENHPTMDEKSLKSALVTFNESLQKVDSLTESSVV